MAGVECRPLALAMVSVYMEPMPIAQRMVETLDGAEKALAALASEAAKESDYDAASCLIDLARELNGLALKARQQLEHTPSDSTTPSPPPSAGDWAFALATNSRLQLRGKQKKGDYPRFFREGENLIKIGWSPSSKAEYEQKTPKRVLEVLAAAIAKIATNGKRFTMERLLPLVDSQDGHTIPDYQSYICLKWLRQQYLLVQHGRQGYSLATKDRLEASVNTCWAKLPTR